jgi:hypothetical protein
MFPKQFLEELNIHQIRYIWNFHIFSS